jgi:hypothetical protein
LRLARRTDAKLSGRSFFVFTDSGSSGLSARCGAVNHAKILVSKWSPKEAKVGEILETSVSLWDIPFCGHIQYICRIP